MDKKKAFEITRSLMDQHGLTQWKLEWMHLKTTAGLCYNSKLTWNKKPELSRGRISISSIFIEVFTEAEVRELALHEIAHALVPPGSHHGPEWKHMAKKIGSTGERCMSAEEANKVGSRYEGVCPQDHMYRRHRKTWDMTTHNLICPPCRKKKLVAAIVWTDTHTGVTLNPLIPKKPDRVPGTRILVTTQFEPKKAPLTLPKVVPAPAASNSWKDRFDKGDTSFADVW